MANRREFLKQARNFGAWLIAGPMLSTFARIRRAQALNASALDSLTAALNVDGSQLLLPSDAQFAAYQIAFNKRTLINPQIRVLPKSANAVVQAIQWAKANKVPLAIRCGGHSYEGYSQSDGMVIDVRMLNTLDYDAATQTVRVGSGVNLGAIYKYLSPFNRAIPAGSCPPVGVAGHTLGGGFGLIARKFGLACDSVVSMELVTADGKIITVSESEYPDLFWALRGGGNGNFGIVTQFTFQTHPVGQVATFGASWILPPDKATAVVKAWQAWAPNAPDDITCMFKLSRTPEKQIHLHCAGLTVGSPDILKKELVNLTKVLPADGLSITPMTFFDSVRHFSGGFDYGSVFMKAKSDYLFEPMSDEGINTLLKSLLSWPQGIVAIFDSYGGAVGRIKNDATAFAHRENAQYVIQYYSEWKDSASTATRLQIIRSVYDSMRPYVSGSCYVNYCDLDLKNPQEAYWGTNLPRLMRIKAAVDPENFFHHPQSIQPA